MAFSDLADEYVVLTIRWEDYRGFEGELPPGYRIHIGPLPPALRRIQRRELPSVFAKWYLPHYGILPGWRRESPIHIVTDDDLAGGVYLCDRNEFGLPRMGDLQYSWVSPRHQGKGLYRHLFRAGVSQGPRMNLDGMVLNTDREELPAMYGRYGAVEWKRIAKARQAGLPPRVRGLTRTANKYARIAIERATRRRVPRTTQMAGLRTLSCTGHGDTIGIVFPFIGNDAREPPSNKNGPPKGAVSRRSSSC